MGGEWRMMKLKQQVYQPAVLGYFEIRVPDFGHSPHT
jgi:hypothetical protein